MAQLKVKLVRSLVGKTGQQRQTARGLGLRKPNQTVIVDDTPAFRGAINKIAHMVDVEEIEE